MGKRSDFKRMVGDKYRTPEEAMRPLLRELRKPASFIEPCAGNGQMVDHLTKHGFRCVLAIDIDPDSKKVIGMDALRLDPALVKESGAKYFITNPPWTRELLHPLIDHLSDILPTWLLFDADWMHTKQAAPYLTKCSKIISVGRIKWIPGSTMLGKDNAAWYCFQKRPAETIFKGRGL